MSKKTDHLTNAMKSVIAAQQEMDAKVRGHSKILIQQGLAIAALEKQVVELRNCAISAEVRSGVPSKAVAEKYGLSAGRITQLAPRNQH